MVSFFRLHVAPVGDFPSSWLDRVQRALRTLSISALHVIVDEEVLDEVLFVEPQERPSSHVSQDCLATRLFCLSVNLLCNLLR